MELIHKIDEAHYDYKPTPTSMTAKQLATHMLFSFYNFANTAKHGDPSLFRLKNRGTGDEFGQAGGNVYGKKRGSSSNR